MKQGTSGKIKRLLKGALPWLVMALVLWLLSRMLQGVEPGHVVEAIRNLSPVALAGAIGLAFAGYVWLIGYDYLALRYLGRRVPWRWLVFTSLSAFALQRNVGPAPLTGGAVRYRYYKPFGFSPVESAIITALCGFFFTLGIILTASLALLLEPQGLARVLGVPSWWLSLLGALVLLGLMGFLIWSHLRNHPIRIGKWNAPAPSLPQAALQLIFGTIDIAIVAGVVYLLLPKDVDLSYPAFVGIYVLAMLTGALSHVPAGLGVFETVLLLFLPGVEPGPLLASLLAFRGVYYLLPLVVMALVNGLFELGSRIQGRGGDAAS